MQGTALKNFAFIIKNVYCRFIEHDNEILLPDIDSDVNETD